MIKKRKELGEQQKNLNQGQLVSNEPSTTNKTGINQEKKCIVLHKFINGIRDVIAIKGEGKRDKKR